MPVPHTSAFPIMSSEQIVCRLQAHADVKKKAVSTRQLVCVASAKVQSTIALSHANGWSSAGWARSMRVIDRYLPTAEAITVACHCLNRSREGAEFLPQ